MPHEVEGRSAADGCTQSLGGMKAPGALVEARIPSVSVPACVVSRCMYTSVAKCVLRRTHRASERVCAKEPPCMRETPCASGVVTSVPECVLPGTPCGKGAPQGEETTCAREAARVCEPPCVDETPQAEEAACVEETARVCGQPACVDETPRVSAPAGVSSVVSMSEARVSERPCGVRVTACVRSLYTREMTVAMREHAAASPGVRVNGNAIECSLGVVARRCVWVEWRWRLRLWRDKCRVAAVVAIGTGPGLHGRARVVRAVPRTRPPRARLRG